MITALQGGSTDWNVATTLPTLILRVALSLNNEQISLITNKLCFIAHGPYNDEKNIQDENLFVKWMFSKQNHTVPENDFSYSKIFFKKQRGAFLESWKITGKSLENNPQILFKYSCESSKGKTPMNILLLWEFQKKSAWNGHVASAKMRFNWIVDFISDFFLPCIRVVSGIVIGRAWGSVSIFVFYSWYPGWLPYLEAQKLVLETFVFPRLFLVGAF